MGRLYNYFVKRNKNVQYEYERYVQENLAEHYLNRSRHLRLLLKLNWHYCVKKKTTPMIYWSDFDNKSTLENHSINQPSTCDISGPKKEGSTINNIASPTQNNHIIQQNDTDIESLYYRNPVCLKVKGKVLFVSSTGREDRPILDPSTRYRCYHFAEELRRNGLYVSVISASKFIKSPLPEDFDLYVFHRPSKSEEKHILQLKKIHKVLVADYDDLIFGDESIAKHSSICVNKVKTEKECALIYKNNLDVMKHFDIFTCSTQALYDRIKEYNNSAEVFVIHNFLPYSIINRTDGLVCEEKDLNQVIYCCGTISHNVDFDSWKEEIVRALKDDSKLRIVIVGPLDAPEQINSLPNVSFHKALDYWDLFEYMKNSAFAIAPLTNSIFNDCKSNVKFLEAAAVGVTLIASPNGDISRVSDSNILICDNANDIYELLKNRKKYFSSDAIQSGRKYVIDHCSSETFNNEYSKLLDYIER